MLKSTKPTNIVEISDKLHEIQVKSRTFLGYHLQDQIYLGNVSLNEPVRK